MSADPANIPRATRRARIVMDADSAILSAFPKARDQAGNPEPGFFDSASDAAAVLALKAALIGTRRTRYLVPVHDEMWIDPSAGIPTYTLTDTRHSVDSPALLCSMELDMETGVTVLELLV